MTVQEETNDVANYRKADLKQPEDTSNNQTLYLVFDKERKYTEYIMEGIGIKYNFKLSNDTVYIQDTPLYKILNIDKKKLELKKLNTEQIVTYYKSNDDLSKFKVLE